MAAWFVWHQDRRAAAVGFGAGGALVLWIAVQLLVLQRYFFLQPVIAVLGAMTMALDWWWVHRSLQA